jgi:hypothetical protein
MLKVNFNVLKKIYCVLAGVPDVARDYQLRNLMYGVIVWYKEKGLHSSDSESMSRSGCWREYRCVRRNLLQQRRSKCPEDVATRGLRERDTHTHEWAETTKCVEKVIEGPMWIAKKEMSKICDHAAVNMHASGQRGQNTWRIFPDDGPM